MGWSPVYRNAVAPAKFVATLPFKIDGALRAFVMMPGLLSTDTEAAEAFRVTSGRKRRLVCVNGGQELPSAKPAWGAAAWRSGCGAAKASRSGLAADASLAVADCDNRDGGIHWLAAPGSVCPNRKRTNNTATTRLQKFMSISKVQFACLNANRQPILLGRQ